VSFWWYVVGFLSSCRIFFNNCNQSRNQTGRGRWEQGKVYQHVYNFVATGHIISNRSCSDFVATRFPKCLPFTLFVHPSRSGFHTCVRERWNTETSQAQWSGWLFVVYLTTECFYAPDPDCYCAVPWCTVNGRFMALFLCLAWSQIARTDGSMNYEHLSEGPFKYAVLYQQSARQHALTHPRTHPPARAH
jgi:hypothetical protein